jgi:hypothetical protein
MPAAHINMMFESDCSDCEECIAEVMEDKGITQTAACALDVSEIDSRLKG